MKQSFNLKDLFDWNAHPKNVFLVAIPLAIICLSLSMIRCILEIKYNHDWTYLILFFGMTPLMALPVIMIYKNQKLIKEAK